ncbi:DUF4097 family beta strand repeat-containing protein [Kitasatospora viridis]|uniref:Putative adhesin n=1 Tax=Kitasatospora viridis TaxID=281105 RepID=A0A561ULC3_9ACTN|nr:DUF4097 family beta strand repeat-containing protein [Kitasatospora viridis]TWG00168.1 putative adhesin [Kitasatospora viridis]
MTAAYRRWRAVGVVAAVLLTLTGAGQTWRALAQQDRSDGYRYPQITALDLDLQNASTQVTPSVSGEVEVSQSTHWTVSQPVVKREVVDGRLKISVRCPEVFPIGAPNCRTNLTIGVPADTKVSVRGSSADTAITGLTGELNLHATSGTFALSDDTGRVTAQVTSGSVTGRGLSSSQVQAQVTSGSVNLTFISAPEVVALSAGSGSVRALFPQGTTYRVAVSTGSGGSTVDRQLQDPASQRSVTATADSGSVTLKYADN